MQTEIIDCKVEVLHWYGLVSRLLGQQCPNCLLVGIETNRAALHFTTTNVSGGNQYW